jgi:hypothetical protein
MAGTIGGLAVDNSSAQVFYCGGSWFNNTFKCRLDGKERNVPNLRNSIFVQESTPYDQSNRGIVAVTTEDKDTIFHLFNIDSFYKSVIISQHRATEDNTHYQRIDNMYTIWTIHSDINSIKVYYYLDSNLNPNNPIIIDAIFLKRDTFDFCPISTQANPSRKGQTFILSQC